MTVMRDDVDRIMAVMQTAFDPAYGEAWSRAQVEGALVMGNTRYVLIAPGGEAPGQGEEAAGFALLHSALDEEELLLFAIDPQWRRRGLGQRLLATALEEAKTSGKIRIFLEMRQGNSAENLYRAAGFTPIGLRPKYYRTKSGERIDAITFGCLLLPQPGQIDPSAIA